MGKQSAGTCTHKGVAVPVKVNRLGVFLTTGKKSSVTKGQFWIADGRCVKSILRGEKNILAKILLHTNILSSIANALVKN